MRPAIYNQGQKNAKNFPRACTQGCESCDSCIQKKAQKFSTRVYTGVYLCTQNKTPKNFRVRVHRGAIVYTEKKLKIIRARVHTVALVYTNIITLRKRKYACWTKKFFLTENLKTNFGKIVIQILHFRISIRDSSNLWTSTYQ